MAEPLKKTKTDKKDAPKKAPPERKPDEKKPGPFRQLVDFIADVRRELRKVAWPTRQDTLASTWVVIVITIVFSVFLFLCDSVLMYVVGFLFT
ncbi:preprotein translocase subunit SecE [bacterium]|nr:preprotein translocase subunit SecE [bacterium]